MLDLKKKWIEERRKSPVGHLHPCTHEIGILGINIRFHLMGEHREQEVEFLKTYYDRFPAKPRALRNIEVFFSLPPGEYCNENHKIWNSKWPYHEDWESNSIIYHEERDFVATQLGQREILIVSPPIHLNTDILDNVLHFALDPLISLSHSFRFHAACMEMNSKDCLVFFGPSGAGKSTIAKNIFDAHGCRMLSTDQVYLRYSPDSILQAWSTPATSPEFSRLKNEWCVGPRHVKGIYLLEQQNQWLNQPLDPTQLMKAFYKEVFTFNDPRVQRDVLFAQISEMLKNFKGPKNKLSYPKGEDVWSYVLKDFMGAE